MKRALVAFLLPAAATAHAASSYHVIRHVPIGGEGGWDYITLDSASRRIYQSHRDRVMVLDADKGTIVGTIMNTPGVHGVALAPELNRGFVSDGRSDTVTV